MPIDIIHHYRFAETGKKKSAWVQLKNTVTGNGKNTYSVDRTSWLSKGKSASELGSLFLASVIGFEKIVVRTRHSLWSTNSQPNSIIFHVGRRGYSQAMTSSASGISLGQPITVRRNHLHPTTSPRALVSKSILSVCANMERLTPSYPE